MASTESQRCKGLYQSGGLDIVVLLDKMEKHSRGKVTWVLEQAPCSTYLVSALQNGVGKFRVSLL